MSVGKDRVIRRNRTVGLGVLTCSKAGLGVIARRMQPSVGYYNGNMKMVEVKQNHGWKATHAPQCIASACNRGVFNSTTKVRWNFITVEPAVKMLRDVQV